MSPRGASARHVNMFSGSFHMLKNIGARWTSLQPRLFALAAGLVIGPILTSFLGWQVLSSTASTQAQAAVVASQAKICEARARAEVSNPGTLDWNARQALAKRNGVLIAGASEDYDVTRACADRLRT
jgi:hypothetical protein